MSCSGLTRCLCQASLKTSGLHVCIDPAFAPLFMMVKLVQLRDSQAPELAMATDRFLCLKDSIPHADSLGFQKKSSNA